MIVDECLYRQPALALRMRSFAIEGQVRFAIRRTFGEEAGNRAEISVAV